MKPIRKTHIEFLYSMIEDKPKQTSKARDVSKVKMPEYAYGFRFFDLISVTVEVYGEKIKLTSERINVSPKYVVGERLYTPEDVRREFPDNKAFIGNVSQCKGAFMSRSGEWKLFCEGDVFIKDVA